MVCDSCGKTFKENKRSTELCYRCSISGIGFSWSGGAGVGRSNWNLATFGENHREQMEGAAKQGRVIEKLPKRAELI